MQRPRRPGDQAPPPRAAHRNDHLTTATTHQKDTAGKLYCVHDGSEDRLVVVIDGKPAWGVSYPEARRLKDVAVTRLKERKASIQEIDPDAELEDPAGDEGLEAYIPEGETRETTMASLTEVQAQIEASLSPEDRAAVEQRKQEIRDSFHAPDQALEDPQLEANRQKAVRAASSTAAEAQQRAYASAATKKEAIRIKAEQIKAMPKAKPGEVVRAPGWTPGHASNKAQNTGKAPGWTPSPKGVSTAKQAAPAKAQAKAPGWDKPTGGLTADAPVFGNPQKAAKIELDNPAEKPDENDEDDLMMAPVPDLETDVKTETERAHAAAKDAWTALSEVEQATMKARIVRAADLGEREKMFAAMEPAQVEQFEVYEAAFVLLFGPPSAVATGNTPGNTNPEVAP